MIFDIENWLWKSNFGTFWHLPTTPILKIQYFPLGMLILSIFVPPTWKLNNPYYHKSTHQKEKVLLRLAAAALHNAHCSKMVLFVQKIF